MLCRFRDQLVDRFEVYSRLTRLVFFAIFAMSFGRISIDKNLNDENQLRGF